MLKERTTINQMHRLCEILAQKSGQPNTKNMLDGEIIAFLAYLAASDGVLSWSECRYISELFDMNITPEKLDAFIENQDIYSENFESNPPVMLQAFVLLDNNVHNNQVEMGGELGGSLVQVYAALANGLIVSNGRTLSTMEPQEEKNLNIYLNMMQKYVDDHTDAHHMDLRKNYVKRKKDSIE